MGNRITSARRGSDRYLKLSNGSTSVLLSVLLLSGSDLARSRWEQEFMTWLAEHDQMVYGIGMVGFDLDDIVWNADTFDDQRAFVLRTIDLALRRHRWDTLSYDPPFVARQLDALRALVADYQPRFDTSAARWQWPAPDAEMTTCVRHKVFTHEYGCLLCNEGD